MNNKNSQSKRTYLSVYEKMWEWGLIKNETLWSEEEDNIIKKYYPLEGAQCYKRLKNRTAAACKKRAQILDIKRIGYKWTKEEDDIIRQYYPIEGKQCFKRLLFRTAKMVQGRAHLLGIHDQTINYWTAEDIEYLKTMYPLIGMKVADKLTNHTKQAIASKASELKLERHKKKIICIETNHQYDSITQAATELNISRKGISNCLLGKQKVVGIYHFQYIKN